MSFFKSFESNQVKKLVHHYTGERIDPRFICSCDSDIESDWRGVAVIERSNLWLVNRLGARGISINRLSRGNTWGQFPVGTRGYPHYGFSFIAENGPIFSVYPIKVSDGSEFEKIISEYLPSVDNTILDVKETSRKKCKQCGEYQGIFSGQCSNCGSRSFDYSNVKENNYFENELKNDTSLPTNEILIHPEFKSCPFCAEDIKFAAIKCRYCGEKL